MKERKQLLKEWLSEHFQTNHYIIETASADASFRSYYRATLNDETFIVMDAPPEHEDCNPFMNTTAILQSGHINVPNIIASNKTLGFLLLTDLGNTHYLAATDNDNADELYHDAIDSLISIQLNANSETLPVYSHDLLQQEMNLFHEWLLNSYLSLALTEDDYHQLSILHETLIDNAISQPQVFVHRDYHSRNLMVTEVNNPGIIDHQDAVKGPITYDLVSLLKDSYIHWSKQKQNEWINYYLEQLKLREPKLTFEHKQFKKWFDLMGVQRELKVAGIFVRLFLRDNKSTYLKDIPLTLNHILDLADTYSELNWIINFINNKVLPALENKI